jgi:Tfp pilus assembly protein PilN
MRLKGRHWLMLWLVVFVCVLLAIAARQSAGFRTARHLGELREERTALEERQIRAASSRQVLVPLAERRLGLHQPSDSEFTLLPLAPLAEDRP